VSDPEEHEYQDNPALANWTKMAEKRESFEGATVSSDIEYGPVKVNRKTDPKSGKTSVTFGGGPFIKAFDPDGGAFHYVTENGKRVKFSKISLFTFTSKMSCPSFSIPAGPTYGGTCPASKPQSIKAEGSYTQYSPALETMRSGQKFICDLCYAGKSNYLLYPNVSAGQMAKKQWVMNTMADGTFVDKMSQAIEMLFDKRMEQVFLANALSNRFFRIHDSGDFFTKDYYRAWVEVCNRFKGRLNPDGGHLVYFWAPTRMWVFSDYVDLFRNVPPPPNFALRPSALFTDAPPPRIQGMAAGSTSTAEEVGAELWNCPAYESETATCAGTRCRKCWTMKKVPVNYHTH
jgi:hypothetical protein